MTKPIRPLKQDVHAVVLVPSDGDWQALRQAYEDLRPGMALGHEFLSRNFGRRRVVFVHTGDDPVDAAISAQYAVDRWSPRLLASDAENHAFTHVALRNGLQLMPVEDLGLSSSAMAATPVRTAANITTTNDVSTSDDVSTVDDVIVEENFSPDGGEVEDGNETGTEREPV
jgi:hypothetical protein